MSGSKQSVKVKFPPLLQGRACGPQCLDGLLCNVMYPCLNQALGLCRLVLTVLCFTGTEGSLRSILPRTTLPAAIQCAYATWEIE